nr:alpha/beta fold hydrolase [Thalassococcus arenae]
MVLNGTRHFIDIDGAGLVAQGPAMVPRPTMILIHGGPGADHSIYKPQMSGLTDLCQLVYIDLRGNGRSDDGDPADWTLAQWGDDIRALCDTLGIVRPIVYGASFGGVVAQAYATRHPDHPGALLLGSTTARTDFEAIYAAFAALDPKAGEVARAYWSAPTPESRQAYFETCLPLYATRGLDPDIMARMIVKNPVAMHYNGPDNEQGRFDFRAALAQVSCPALVLSGECDPIMPPEFGRALAQALPNSRYAEIAGAAHMIDRDRPRAFFDVVLDFVSEVAPLCISND